MEEIDQQMIHREALRNVQYVEYLEQIELEDTYANTEDINVLDYSK